MPTPIKSSTQDHLDIFDITNNILILRSGACALVLKLNALNFNLLSYEEQEATIYAYASLLNSLSFPVQILIRSEKKDISNYLKLLAAQEARQTHPVYQQRIASYRVFIEKLVKERNVLDKKFYVVIPFSEYELGITSSTFSPIQAPKKDLPFDKAYIIHKALNSLHPKRDHLIRQFAHLGLIAKQLATSELIRLFYHIYNPGAGESVALAESSQYQTPLVQSTLIESPKDALTLLPSPA